jgi:hypothetical protein
MAANSLLTWGDLISLVTSQHSALWRTVAPAPANQTECVTWGEYRTNALTDNTDTGGHPSAEIITYAEAVAQASKIVRWFNNSTTTIYVNTTINNAGETQVTIGPGQRTTMPSMVDTHASGDALSAFAANKIGGGYTNGTLAIPQGGGGAYSVRVDVADVAGGSSPVITVVQP